MTNLERMRLAAAKKTTPLSVPPLPAPDDTFDVLPEVKLHSPPPKKKPKFGRVKKLDVALEKSRLPDGSSFTVRYSALAVRWIGTLTVPRPGDDPKVFHGEASGVFKLLTSLDFQYRDWLAYKAKQLTQPPAAQ